MSHKRRQTGRTFIWLFFIISRLIYDQLSRRVPQVTKHPVYTETIDERSDDKHLLQNGEAECSTPCNCVKMKSFVSQATECTNAGAEGGGGGGRNSRAGISHPVEEPARHSYKPFLCNLYRSPWKDVRGGRGPWIHQTLRLFSSPRSPFGIKR